MRWIFLSPHFDDAVLSCGGLIWEYSQAGKEVEIWTIMAGNPPPGPISDFAVENHMLWGIVDAEETLRMRRLEDKQAAKIVGARTVHFKFPDCIYRRSKAGGYLYTQTVMTPPLPEDEPLAGKIWAALEEKVNKEDILVSPLALGGHVDHILVRQAAEELNNLYFYADIPYVLNAPGTLEEAIPIMEGCHFEVSDAGMKAWLEGVKAYKSQVNSLFKGEGTLFDAIRSRWRNEDGLRLWKLN